VAVLTVDVNHLEVDHLDVVFFDKIQNIIDCFCHNIAPLNINMPNYTKKTVNRQ
jgi:hypothetical protein